MTRFAAIVAVLVMGCGGAQEPVRVAPQRTTAPRADVVKVTDEPEPAPSRDDIESEYLVRLQAQFARDPLAVIDAVRADYTGSDEDIAKKLYYRWKAAHPDPVPPATAPTPPPPRQTYVAPALPRPVSGWWCADVSSKVDDDDHTSACNRTLDECEEFRKSMAESAANRDDLYQVITECATQRVASCFDYRSILQGWTRTSCLPSVVDCKHYASFLRRKNADDYKVLTACTAAK